jgi:hypothetical protein
MLKAFADYPHGCQLGLLAKLASAREPDLQRFRQQSLTRPVIPLKAPQRPCACKDSHMCFTLRFSIAFQECLQPTHPLL